MLCWPSFKSLPRLRPSSFLSFCFVLFFSFLHPPHNTVFITPESRWASVRLWKMMIDKSSRASVSIRRKLHIITKALAALPRRKHTDHDKWSCRTFFAPLSITLVGWSGPACQLSASLNKDDLPHLARWWASTELSEKSNYTYLQCNFQGVYPAPSSPHDITPPAAFSTQSRILSANPTALDSVIVSTGYTQSRNSFEPGVQSQC